MVQVANVDEICAKARELGGSVMGEPTDVPGSRIAGIEKPTGTIVSIASYST